jgi:hypothetical protein
MWHYQPFQEPFPAFEPQFNPYTYLRPNPWGRQIDPRYINQWDSFVQGGVLRSDLMGHWGRPQGGHPFSGQLQRPQTLRYPSRYRY